MISLPIELQAPFLIIVVGMALCLVFEAAGVPEGLRRFGNKNYITLIAAIVVACVFTLIFRASPEELPLQSGLIFDSLAKSAILSLSVSCACVLWIIAERLKPGNGDRGELYALTLFVYFCSIVIVCADDWTLIGTASLASMISQVGILSMRKKRRTAPEVALKLTVLSGFFLFFLSLIFLASASGFAQGALVLMLCLTLFLIGIVPLQSHFVDILDGAPSYSAAFYGGATLVSSATILMRVVHNTSLTPETSERILFALIVFSALSVCIPPFMALDQRRIGRLVAYMINAQGGIVLIVAIIALGGSQVPHYLYGFMFTHFSLCSVGAFAGLNYWKNTRHAFRTWEDFAGAGREHPIAAGAFFFILSSICGLPFTSGFVLRKALIEVSPAEYRLPIALILLASVFLSAIPTYRLFAFFFGKTTRHELRQHIQKRPAILMLLCATLLFLSGIAPASVLNAIFGH